MTDLGMAGFATRLRGFQQLLDLCLSHDRMARFEFGISATRRIRTQVRDCNPFRYFVHGQTAGRLVIQIKAECPKEILVSVRKVGPNTSMSMMPSIKTPPGCVIHQ